MHNLPIIVQSDLPPGFAFGGLEYWLRFAHTLRRQPHPFERLFGGGPEHPADQFAASRTHCRRMPLNRPSSASN